MPMQHGLNERICPRGFLWCGYEDAATYDGEMIVLMTMPLTRKSGVVARSVVINSSAPLDFAAAIWSASSTANPKVHASVYACWIRETDGDTMCAARAKNRSYKSTS